jgi:DNA-binding MarR family transcriptional regulator
MPDKPTKRDELLRQLLQRFQVHTTMTVLFHEAIGDHFGLNASDHKCFNILMSSPRPLTPTELANMTGLTTGAITGILDRLEKAGFVRRERDKRDRRSLTIHPVEERNQEISQLFGSVSRSTLNLLSRYSDEELGFILDLVNQLIGMAEKEIRNLQNKDS